MIRTKRFDIKSPLYWLAEYIDRANELRKLNDIEIDSFFRFEEIERKKLALRIEHLERCYLKCHPLNQQSWRIVQSRAIAEICFGNKVMRKFNQLTSK